MRLFISENSPYVRKVRIVVRELGCSAAITEEVVDPRADGEAYWRHNPTGRIPALELGDGRVLGQSDLIAAHLFARFGPAPAGHFTLPEGTDRLLVHSLAEGALEAALGARYEKRRAEALRDDAFTALRLDAARRCLAQLEAIPGAGATEAPDYASAALASAFDWIALRHPEVAPEETYPALAREVAALNRRASFAATRPDPAA